MKRIAYISTDPGVPAFGTKGCSVHVQEGIRALLQQGARVSLFTRSTGGSPPSDLDKISIHKLPSLAKDSDAIRERAALESNKILKEFLEAEGPFDMVYERYALWSYAGMEYARDQSIPGLLEINAPLIEEQRQHRVLVHEKEAYQVASKIMSDASALIVVSDAVAEYAATFPDTSGKIHVIPNGVDTNRFAPNLDSGETGGLFTVGFVGTLKPWHGVQDLVEGFAILHKEAPNSRLLIVGHGPERDSIENRLGALNLSKHAVFTGAVHPDEVPGWIRVMDVGVAPYPIMENCYFSPLKAFEYMATGIAFVGSNIGQIGKLVAHGIDGLLYDPGNTSQLGDALLSLYHNPAFRIKLGQAARHKVLSSYTWESVGARIMQIAQQQIAYEAV